MAKAQKRSNREIRKPKSAKTKSTPLRHRPFWPPHANPKPSCRQRDAGAYENPNW